MRKVALITGGAVRVGRAITLGLAEAGFDVAIHYNRSEGPARETVLQVEALGRQAITIGGNLADPDTAESVADAVRQAYGRLDVLVNSAASFESAALFALDATEWDRVMAVNLRAPYLLVRATEAMLKEAGGNVVNMVDLSAFDPFEAFPHHSISKAGLMHLTRAMARSMAPRVRVNAIAPGFVLAPPGMSDETARAEVAQIPVGRSGTPEDVVRTVLFLVASPFITGEVIVVDGGQRIAGKRDPDGR